ncbi:MAG: response regulator transcription factor [Hyphomicrobiaceae bacterium]|nr:response regulator transcription factor [Hyphomicrobiaceae bacterium]
MRLLILDDDKRFGTLLSEHVSASGLVADVVTSVADFRAQADPSVYDLYVIDLNLPDGDGIEVVRDCRRLSQNIPILIITARSTVSQRVTGLDAGADDYLIKPFHAAEFQARVRALLRRPPTCVAPKLHLGQISVETGSGAVYFNGQRAILRPAEQKLLTLLMRRLGVIISKDAIYNQIYGMETCATPNAVEQVVSRLRKALAVSTAGVDVKTVRGIGYHLEEVRVREFHE